MLDFGRDICGTLDPAESREWLVTNGIGGYASGTVAGTLTRRYHGLLIAATKPPVERVLVLSKLDETAQYDGQDYALFVNRWGPDQVEPDGCRYLERFHLEGTTPVWTYALGDARLVKRVWMQQEDNTTYIQYKLAQGSQPLKLDLKVMVNYRDHHGNTVAWKSNLTTQPTANGLKLLVDDKAVAYVLCQGAEFEPAREWTAGYYLAIEAYRGQNEIDDHLMAGHFTAEIQPGQSLTVVASTRSRPNLDGSMAYIERRMYEQGMISGVHLHPDRDPVMNQAVQHLLLAADQFIVRRPTDKDPDGRTVIAGYHWFTDWGRDTMIALPGLTLTTHRTEAAASILRTFAQFVDQGMIPNRFPDVGESPEYNTVDATLWFVEAVRAYHAARDDLDLVRELFPVLKDIVDWHVKGTRYHIKMDDSDGLIYSGEPGVQLTWMDAKVGDYVVTPRTGKAVEINALWINALVSLAGFAEALGESPDRFNALAEKAKAGFARFWNAEKGYCYDVLDGPHGDDDALRPNQLFAVSLEHGPLTGEQARQVVDVCARHLLTSHGLRSLAPDHPDYIPVYGGDLRTRDGAYHQGTVWGWLIGPFVAAHLKVYKDKKQARDFLRPLLRHMSAHGVGSISEIFDADPPHTPRGCMAQAWSIAEVLRLWQMTGD